MELNYPVNSIAQYNKDNNHKTLHPLVTVIDFSLANIREWGDANKIRFQYGMYSIILKDVKCGDLKYGRHTYDYQAGTLVFFAPGQIVEIENPKVPYQPMGHGLVFHPDLLVGTHLGRIIAQHKFFHYESHEALHLSDDERQMILDCFAKIHFELKQPIDTHSKKLIVSNIELFLGYCQRFYDRQFITREHVNKGILERFETLLNDYFETDQTQSNGIPSVSYFANELHLSANYFGDLIKRETGFTAKDYIQNKIIDIAKNRVFDSEKTINEIAFDMGFKYPQHFTRMFKQRVGKTPNQYRSVSLS